MLARTSANRAAVPSMWSRRIWASPSSVSPSLDSAISHLSSRLLKKAHLPRWRARAALRRTRKYASHLHPPCGWVPGAPPCIWTSLSSLGVNEFFSILLGLPVGNSRLQKKQKPSPHKFREGFGSLPGNPEFARCAPRPGFSRSLVGKSVDSYQTPPRMSTEFLENSASTSFPLVPPAAMGNQCGFRSSQCEFGPMVRQPHQGETGGGAGAGDPQSFRGDRGFSIRLDDKAGDPPKMSISSGQ